MNQRGLAMLLLVAPRRTRRWSLFHAYADTRSYAASHAASRTNGDQAPL